MKTTNLTLNLMNTSAPSALLHPARMSPVERAAGRFLRAPDGHEGGEGGGDASGGAEGADAGSGGQDEGKQPEGSDAGAGDAGAGGDAGADAGKGDEGKADEGTGDGSIAGDAGAAGEEGKDGEGDKPTLELLGAPEGDYDVKAPEGMEFDQAAFDAVKDDFRELGLSNAGAQRFVDLYAAKVLPLLTERAQKAGQEKMVADMAALKKGWADEARKDPVIGGAKFDETVDRIARVWDKLGVKKGEGARAILDDSGLGNHPDILKLLGFTGSVLEETKFVPPTGAGADNRPIWDRIYSDPEPATK